MSYRDIVAMETRAARSTVTGVSNVSRLRIKVAGRTVTTMERDETAARQKADAGKSRVDTTLARGELEGLYNRMKTLGFPETRGGADPDAPANPVPEITPAAEEPQEPNLTQPTPMSVSDTRSEQGEQSWTGWLRRVTRRIGNTTAAQSLALQARMLQLSAPETRTNPPGGVAGSEVEAAHHPRGYQISAEEYAMILRERERGAVTPHIPVETGVRVGGQIGVVHGARELPDATPTVIPPAETVANNRHVLEQQHVAGRSDTNLGGSVPVPGANGISQILSTLGVDKPRTLAERLNAGEPRARAEFVELKRTRPLSEVLAALNDVRSDLVPELMALEGDAAPLSDTIATKNGDGKRIRVRVPKPEPFTGVSGVPTRIWLRNLRAYLLHESGLDEITPELLLAAEQYLTKAAREYWEGHRARLNRENVTITWEVFSDLIVKGFGGIDPAQTARDKLAAMRQRKGETAEKLTVRFLQQLSLLEEPMAEADMIMLFRNALLPDLRTRVVTALATRRISAFAEYADFVRRFEQDLRVDELIRKPHNDVDADTNGGHVSGKRRRSGKGRDKATKTTKLNQVKTEKEKPVKAPPPAQTAPNSTAPSGSGSGEQIKPKQCFGCKQEGRLAKDCPVLRKAQQLLAKEKSNAK